MGLLMLRVLSMAFFCFLFRETGAASDLHRYTTSKYLNRTQLGCLSCHGYCERNRTLCDCGRDCEKYGDCCPDFKESCFAETGKELSLKKPKYLCFYWRYVKNYCSYSERACEMSMNDINTRIPVTDVETGEHYTNTLCASCNGATNVIPWQVTVLSDTEVDIGAKIIADKGILSSLKLIVAPPNGSNDRWCINDKTEKGQQLVISKCDRKWRDSHMRKACEYGDRQYVNVDYAIYRNVFCALCNNEAVGDLECTSVEKIPSEYVPPPAVYSYRLYFHFGTVHGLTISKICQPGFVYSSEERKCVSIYTSFEAPIPNMVLNITLKHKNPRLPKQEAQEIVKYLSINFRTLNFSTEYTQRNWQKGFDNYQIRVDFPLRSPNGNGNISAISEEIVTLLQNNTFLGFETININIYISKYIDNCYNTPHTEGTFISDKDGRVTLYDGQVVNPGDYIYHNQSLVACWRHKIDTIVGWVTLISMLLSIFCLVLHLILNVVYKPNLWWRTTGLACCLIITNLTYLLQPVVSFTYMPCYIAGVVLHWSYLVSFAWMDFIAVEIWKTIRAKTGSRDADSTMKNSIIKVICILLFPTLIVISVIIMDPFLSNTQWNASYGSGIMCWIAGRNVLIYLFVAPGALSILISLLFTLLSAIRLMQLWRKGKNSVAKQRNYFFMFVKLSVMTGVGWCMGFLALPTENNILLILFVLFTATQGMALLFVIWGRECRRVIDRQLAKRRENSSEGGRSAQIVQQCTTESPLVHKRS